MKNKILLGTLIALGVVCVAVGGFWLGSQNKSQVGKQTNTNTQTTETKKSESVDNSASNVANSANITNKLYELTEGHNYGGLVIDHPKQLAILNISEGLKTYITKTITEKSGDCGTSVISLISVYGDYAYAGIGGGGGLSDYEIEQRGCGSGALLFMGPKNGQVDKIWGGQAAPTCADQKTWGAPAEILKDLPCEG